MSAKDGAVSSSPLKGDPVSPMRGNVCKQDYNYAWFPTPPAVRIRPYFHHGDEILEMM